MGPVDPWNQQVLYLCAFCRGPGGQRHHLVPQDISRTKSKLWWPKEQENEDIRVCNTCHRQIHDLFDNRELAALFNTEELLKAELKRRLQTV